MSLPRHSKRSKGRGGIVAARDARVLPAAANAWSDRSTTNQAGAMMAILRRRQQPHTFTPKNAHHPSATAALHGQGGVHQHVARGSRARYMTTRARPNVASQWLAHECGVTKRVRLLT